MLPPLTSATTLIVASLCILEAYAQTSPLEEAFIPTPVNTGRESSFATAKDVCLQRESYASFVNFNVTGFPLP